MTKKGMTARQIKRNIRKAIREGGMPKILTMGHFPIPTLTKRVVDNIFECLRGGDIVVEGGMRELKAEVLNMIREDILENAEYASSDQPTVKAALLVARLKAEVAWRQFRIDVKQLKEANLS